MVAKGEGRGGGKDWELGVSRCKLLYIGWINNKVLLYSTGNYIQYPTINHYGKEYRDFPGGTVVKNPPANAGGMGSILGPGRSHMPWSN